jgi:hypothetical protein
MIELTCLYSDNILCIIDNDKSKSIVKGYFSDFERNNNSNLLYKGKVLCDNKLDFNLWPPLKDKKYKICPKCLRIFLSKNKNISSFNLLQLIGDITSETSINIR